MAEGLKERLSSRTALAGIIVKMAAPALVEMAGWLGFDLVTIDTEHGPGDGYVLEHHMRAADAAGIPVLVRVPANDPVSIQAALDAGADGVIVPHVSSAAQAERAVRAAHYPPHGERGVALTTRAARQGTRTLADHLTASSATVVVVQIEDPDGVRNAEAIAGVKGVDAVWLGPNDLAATMGDSQSSARVTAAIESVCRATVASPAALVALCADTDDRERWTARGASVSLFTLHSLLRSAADAVLATRA